MVVAIEERAHDLIDDLEIALHLVRVERVCLERELHLPRVPMWKAALVRVLRKHMAILDLERFANAIRHESDVVLPPEEGRTMP
jgi:hypothetical protein